jgi:hypothetical protein
MLYVFHSPFTPFDNNRVTVVAHYSEGILRIAVARNGKKDNFCRKTGRIIALGRLVKDKLFIKFPVEEMNNEIFIKSATLVASFVNYTKKIQLTEQEMEESQSVFEDIIEEIKQKKKEQDELDKEI